MDNYFVDWDGWVYDPRYFDIQDQEYENDEYYLDEDKELQRVSCLYLKAYLGNQEAISELNQIAQKHGMKDFRELMEYTDVYLSERIYQANSEFRDKWIIEHVIEEAFRDEPRLNFKFAREYAQKDNLVFRQIFEDSREWEEDIFKNYPEYHKLKPLPMRPSVNASVEEWFSYYDERKELGIPITISEIARIKNYSQRYLRQLHMRYNYSQEKGTKKKKKT